MVGTEREEVAFKVVCRPACVLADGGTSDCEHLSAQRATASVGGLLLWLMRIHHDFRRILDQREAAR